MIEENLNILIGKYFYWRKGQKVFSRKDTIAPLLTYIIDNEYKYSIGIVYNEPKTSIHHLKTYYCLQIIDSWFGNPIVVYTALLK